jgi:hypothetical protein
MRMSILSMRGRDEPPIEENSKGRHVAIYSLFMELLPVGTILNQGLCSGMMMSLSISVPNDGPKETDKLLIVRLQNIRKEADFAIVTGPAEPLHPPDPLNLAPSIPQHTWASLDCLDMPESCRYHSTHMLVVDSLS